ncbi:flagellar hook protein FlgE [Halomonas sp. 86]|uniref:flagellar hook protein FlgE n=1 Tax=unclassified Halomonas TaxID=2609666 RepID=UPI0040331D8A
MSFSQALSGLNAQQQKLGAIGNNIANSQTVGFKSSNVQFADVFAESRIGLGVRTSTVLQNFSQGNVESTNRNMDLAIAGDGFFRFQQTNGEVGYSRNGQLTMTADGRLVNAQGAQIMGYGVNAQGQVQAGGQPVALTVDSDELGANATTNVNVTFNLDSREVSGSDLSSTELASGEIIDYHYVNNFTAYDSLGNPVNATVYYEKVGGAESQNVWQAKVVADGTYDPANDFLVEFNANGGLVGVRESSADYLTAQENYQVAQTGFLNAQEVRDTAQALATQRESELDDAQTAQTDAETARGAAETAQAEAQTALTTAEAALAALAPGDPGYDDAQEAVTAAQAAFDAADTELTTAEEAVTAAQTAAANAQTALDAANAELTTAATALTAAEGTRDTAQATWLTAFNALESGQQKEIAFDIDSGGEPLVFKYNPAGSTQFGNDSTTSALTQNGYTSGALVGITIQNDGTVMRNYSNEQSRAAGQIALVSFRNPEGLKPEGDNLWTATASSGQELVGAAGTGLRGMIEASAVETSNVDMARELVDMIVAQRAYQANSQTISTQDELLQTIINL